MYIYIYIPRVRPFSDRHAVSMHTRARLTLWNNVSHAPRLTDSPRTRSKFADESGHCISSQLAQVNAKQRLPSSLPPLDCVV